MLIPCSYILTNVILLRHTVHSNGNNRFISLLTFNATQRYRMSMLVLTSEAYQQ